MGFRQSKVLIIDDCVDTAYVTEKILRIYDYETMIANSGREGIAAAHRFIPDTILLDLVMADSDGFEIAKILRRCGRTQGVYLIAYTGFYNERIEQDVVDSGFDRMLHKPATIADILCAVNHTGHLVSGGPDHVYAPFTDSYEDLRPRARRR